MFGSMNRGKIALVTAIVLCSFCSIESSAQVPGQEAYETATTEYLAALNGFLEAYFQAFVDETYDDDPFDFNGTAAARTAKTTYLQLFAGSLSLINDLQRAGRAHYNPAYLQGADDLLLRVQAGEADTPHGASELYASIERYGGLYHGIPPFNFYIYLQQRRIGMYRIAYVDAHPRAFNPKSKLRVGQGPLVRRDFSDCANSDVQDNDPSLVGGTVLIVLNENGSSRITVTLTRAKANTVYHFFLKCVRGLGDILTDAHGAATKTFDLQPADARNTFTFDMYPDGAPAGNKYQSVQIQLD
jgi:hypothetical protein